MMMRLLKVLQGSVSNVLQYYESHSKETGPYEVTDRSKVGDGSIVRVSTAGPHPVDENIAEVK